MQPGCFSSGEVWNLTNPIHALPGLSSCSCYIIRADAATELFRKVGTVGVWSQVFFSWNFFHTLRFTSCTYYAILNVEDFRSLLNVGYGQFRITSNVNPFSQVLLSSIPVWFCTAFPRVWYGPGTACPACISPLIYCWRTGMFRRGACEQWSLSCLSSLISFRPNICWNAEK